MKQESHVATIAGPESIWKRLQGLAQRFFAKRGLPQALAVLVATNLGIHLILGTLGPSLLFDNGWGVAWPVNGVTVAILIMVPRRYWPPILIGCILDQMRGDFSKPAREIIVNAFDNSAEILTAAFILPPFRNLADWMAQPRLIQRFIVGAVLLAPVLTSIPAGLLYRSFYHLSFWQYSLRWDFADMLGMAIWLPITLALRSRETYDLFRPQAILFTVSLLGFTGTASWLIFHQETYPVAFVIMPILLFVVFRLGFSGSAIATILVTIIVSDAALHFRGPFQLMPQHGLSQIVILVQLFLTLSVLFSLPISVLMLQRARFEQQLKDAYTRMEAVATEDGLTGVANRRRLDLTLQAEWRRSLREGRPLALLMVDVDHFKLYNDSFGHLSGDDCLRRVAEAIASVVQRSGDLVARYGGEEFSVLLPGAGETATRRVAEFITASIVALEIAHRGSDYGIVTVSIGGHVLYPGPSVSTTTLIEGADRALYQAKQNGRNRVEFTPALKLSHRSAVPIAL